MSESEWTATYRRCLEALGRAVNGQVMRLGERLRGQGQSPYAAAAEVANPIMAVR